MASKDTVRVAKLATTTDKQYLTIDVFYSKGGMNYATYKTEPRGYYVSVIPITDMGDGCTRIGLFKGAKHVIAEVTRFSAVRLVAVADEVARSVKESTGYMRDLIAHVCEREQLQLAPVAAAPSLDGLTTQLADAGVVLPPGEWPTFDELAASAAPTCRCTPDCQRYLPCGCACHEAPL